ncbi:MAG: response regulator transcription factor [bacterium]|nr:response regulator transcription factor [bacterium]
MKRILIVEDDKAIADVVDFAIARAGYETRLASTASMARRQMSKPGLDLIVLDLGLPDGDGLELCRDLRRASDVPVLMLTCRDEELDRVLGLETGADDYMVKPFSTRELIARVRSILRRVEGRVTTSSNQRLCLGRVELRIPEHLVSIAERTVDLTAIEFKLLESLLRTPARVFSRSELIERVYSDECFITERTVDSHIKGIRQKFASIEPGADPIETVFGVGYRARKL